MHCPRCQAEPPRDPFVCTSCGERLLTYLDEPFGPGTGVSTEAVGVAGGQRADSAASRAGPLPPTAGRPSGPGAPAARSPQPPRPNQPSDVNSAVILKLFLGLIVALLLLLTWPPSALIFLGLLAFMMWRLPRLPLVLFVCAVVGTAGTLWVTIDLLDAPGLVEELTATPTPVPTATIQRPAATGVVGTPTLAPAARTATATAVAADNRVHISRARARWLRGDNQGAISEANLALTLLPNQAEALNLRALARIAAGEYAAAAADATAAIAAQPGAATYRDTRGYAWLKAGRYADALDEYDAALVQLKGDDRAASLLGRGIALTALARLPEARISIEDGLLALPNAEPDPQLADLEASGRRALDPLAPRPGAASPIASPAPSPAASPAGRAP
jgi:hypothetical protein